MSLASASSSAAAARMQPTIIDTSHFMSRYFHPKNIAAANGSNPYARAAIDTPYSKTHGLYRQKQVDVEIERIRSSKKPSSSKITIIINATNDLLSVYHHHHHCLDIQLTSGRYGKGRVVWFWEGWETATDERVMKGAIAALDSSWTGTIVQSQSRDGGNGMATMTQGSSGSEAAKYDTKYNAIPIKMSVQSVGQKTSRQEKTTATKVGEKRKRAAAAAESRLMGSYFQQTIIISPG